MKKLADFAALTAVRDALAAEREKFKGRTVYLCAGGGCIASGALKVEKALSSAIADAGLADTAVRAVHTGCMGPCVAGPLVLVEGTLYEHVCPEDAVEIVKEHLVNGKVVTRLVREGADGKPILRKDDIPFFAKQTKLALHNCGRIDPVSIEDYIAVDGYQALAKVLSSMTPEDVVDQMKRSGLRGRGGAGFPTGTKWDFARKTSADVKYTLCNGDEGDPGAFMDRSVLEGDPHSLIEGMCIAAFTIGSAQGYVYVRAEYPLAVERLRIAIAQAHEAGLLGLDILGSGFTFNLDIRMGSGAFVCGEETALIASLEGNRGEPRPRPPFPAVKGLWGKPSLLNNVETYANVPSIILKGGDWYAGWGTEKSKGTKVFALAGNIVNAGLVEVPIGTPLGDLVHDVGGGIPGGKQYKAAQLGGPSGGCVPREYLSTPLDYESLQELGAIMGSGGVVVMDEDSCMVDVARFFLEFVQEESCGKCVPCRVGTKRMLEIVTRICAGEGQEGDIEKLEELGKQIKDTSLCGLGQTAPNPVLSTIRHFRNEYEEHIRQHKCTPGVCPALVDSPCRSACPASATRSPQSARACASTPAKPNAATPSSTERRLRCAA
jgi:NADH-quinone oxidoreductase subunit F